jgi:DNA repair protein RecN (Recombination protein N)
MLTRLSISNYVLIDSLEITFPEGLIIITGQTGAGKSILLGALSLLTGAKADACQISGGGESCVVEAEFTLPSDEDKLRGLLEANEVEWNEGNLIIRRVIHKSGRSRSFVNDSPVPLSLLSELASSLVDIHSQHKSLILTDKHFQLSALDLYAKDGATLAECRKAYALLRALNSELEDAQKRFEALSKSRQYNEAQFEQLEAAKLRDGELEELEQEQKALANAEEIKENLCAAEGALSPQEGSEEIPGVSEALRESARRLQKIAGYISAAQPLADRLESSRIELDDIISEIAELNSGIDVSEGRLQTVEDRMSLLYELMKKHGCQNVAELIQVRDRYSEDLVDSSALEEKIAELRKDTAEAQKHYDTVSQKLSAIRKASAQPFAAAVEESLRFLELERASFIVELSQAAPAADGCDAVSFLFSASGKNPVDVARCASGGELSRIMLSLKAMMAGLTQMPTMIFDEIDTGVSGSVADKMGKMICELGKKMQVFAITHLPQVAAKGDVHYLVSKSLNEESGDFRSSIIPLDTQGRVMELARMLSGSDITPEAVANAKTLLSVK